MTDIEFKVGQEHENMKGVYRVLAINKDILSICWESGEEITTTAALQNRIIERMQRERALVRGTNKGRKSKSKQPKLPRHVNKFEGLKEDDFSKGLAGGAWRHYDSLGGEVAVRLNSDKFDIASWPRYGFSELYWADFDHRRHDDLRLQARFFARLDENCLYFGLCIGGANETMDTKDDWNAFISWLRDPENESWLNKVVSKHDCSVYDIEEEHAVAGTIMSAGGKWRLSNKGHEQEIESLGDLLDNPTNIGTPVDLQIAKIVEKDKVVPRGIKIADDIARLFEVLMPLYEACAVSD
jgi:hypothetical protein